MKKSNSAASKKQSSNLLGRIKQSKLALSVLFALLIGSIGTYTLTQSHALTTINPPTSLTASVVSSSSVQLYWWPSTSTPSPSYKVFRDNVEIAGVGFWLSFDGRVPFTDKGLAPGTSYTYYVQAVNDQGVGNSTPVTVTTSQAPTAAQLGTITGSILGERKAPVPNAKVSVVYNNQLSTVVSDGSGRFSLPNVPAGSYVVTVSADGYKSGSARVNVVGGQSVNVNVSLKAARR